MNDFDLVGNSLFYFGVSFGLILIFEVMILYILEMFFQYPNYMDQYEFWIGMEAFFLALLSMIVLVYRDKKNLEQ
jgi:hypothetical protein